MVMKKHRTSLKDIASRLNVSIATVSRALRNSHEVGDDMKKKVQALAQEMHYRPNPFAQSLRREAPRIIGVVLPDLVTHYYASVLDGIEDYAAKNGYSVISANSHEQYEREERAVNNFIDLHVEGIIACLTQETENYALYEEIKKMGIPLVFFARTCLPESFSSVMGNGDVAAQEATEHLINTGSKRIAFIGGPNHLDMVKRRKHGYLEALREHRLPIDRDLIMCGKISYDTACEQTRTLLARENRPDAILAFNDTIMFAAFDVIKASGLRIPENVALVGFSDADTSARVTPKLTVIMDQAHLQGEKACELLFKNIQGDTKIRKEVVPMILKIRESSDKGQHGK